MTEFSSKTVLISEDYNIDSLIDREGRGELPGHRNGRVLLRILSLALGALLLGNAHGEGLATPLPPQMLADALETFAKTTGVAYNECGGGFDGNVKRLALVSQT